MNIKIEHLYKSYNQISIFEDVNLELNGNGLVFLDGVSGSGKSTLFNIISGMDNFDSGNIYINNQEVSSINRANIGFVFQSYQLMENETVFTNVALPLVLLKETDIKKQVTDVLKKLDIQHLDKRYLSELSQGQKQRVAIARAIVTNPKLILCDEPTGALDLENAINIMKILKKISQNALVIIASHDKKLVLPYCDCHLKIKHCGIEKENDQLMSSSLKDNRKHSELTFKQIFKYRIKPRCLKYIFVALMILSFLSTEAISNTLKKYNDTKLTDYYDINTLVIHKNALTYQEFLAGEHYTYINFAKNATVNDENLEVSAILSQGLNIKENEVLVSPNLADLVGQEIHLQIDAYGAFTYPRTFKIKGVLEENTELSKNRVFYDYNALINTLENIEMNYNYNEMNQHSSIAQFFKNNSLKEYIQFDQLDTTIKMYNLAKEKNIPVSSEVLELYLFMNQNIELYLLVLKTCHVLMIFVMAIMTVYFGYYEFKVEKQYLSLIEVFGEKRNKIKRYYFIRLVSDYVISLFLAGISYYLISPMLLNLMQNSLKISFDALNNFNIIPVISLSILILVITIFVINNNYKKQKIINMFFA